MKSTGVEERRKKKHKIPNQAILIDHLKISRNDENEVTLSEHWHDSL